MLSKNVSQIQEVKDKFTIGMRDSNISFSGIKRNKSIKHTKEWSISMVIKEMHPRAIRKYVFFPLSWQIEHWSGRGLSSMKKDPHILLVEQIDKVLWRAREQYLSKLKMSTPGLSTHTAMPDRCSGSSRQGPSWLRRVRTGARACRGLLLLGFYIVSWFLFSIYIYIVK